MVPKLGWFALMIFQLFSGAKAIRIINYMRYSMFYNKIVFVLDDFPSCRLMLSVLSTFKVG